ncbi:MAG: hypothetical protein JO041_03860, partial [Acidobacteria bacterium]|nr:hypothetical protein [Acidobacteriota bacterium]
MAFDTVYQLVFNNLAEHCFGISGALEGALEGSVKAKTAQGNGRKFWQFVLVAAMLAAANLGFGADKVASDLHNANPESAVHVLVQYNVPPSVQHLE